MKFVFVFNPVAGRGGHERFCGKLLMIPLKKRTVNFTSRRVAATRLPMVRSWCEKHPDEPVQFIACGGDGTINEVINGMVDAKNAILSVYPCGSGNDLGQELRRRKLFPWNVDALLSAPTRKMDLFRIGDRYCGNVTNFGFDYDSRRNR